MDSDSSELPERILPPTKTPKKRSEPTAPKTQRKQRQPESTPQSYKRPRGALVKLGHFTINSDGEDVEELEQRKRKRKKPRKAPSKEATDTINTISSSQTSVRIREEGNTIVILSSDEETEPPVSTSVHSDPPVQQPPSSPPALPSPAPPSPSHPAPAAEQPTATYEPGELQAIYDDALQRSIERHKNRPHGPRRKHQIFQSRTLQILPPITYSDAPPSRIYPLLTPKLFENTLKGLVNQTKALSSPDTEVFSKTSPSQQEIEQRPPTGKPSSPGPPPLSVSPSPPPLRFSSPPRASSSSPRPHSSSPPPPPSSFFPQSSSPRPTPPSIQMESAMDEDPNQTIKDTDVQMEDVSPPSITPSRSTTLSDSATLERVAISEEDSGRAQLADNEDDEEEEAVNISLVNSERESITPSYAPPMSREEEASEEGPARRQPSVPAPHPSDREEKAETRFAEEEALEQQSYPVSPPNNTGEPTTPIHASPSSLGSPVSPIGARTPLPEPNGFSAPPPATTFSPALPQPPRVDTPQVQSPDMGLSLEQRRAVCWSAYRAALEKYKGQQGGNGPVLKMLIDSSAVIEAACVEVSKVQVHDHNSTRGVLVNGIASWNSTLSAEVDDVNIDEDDDDDVDDLELAYPD